MLEPLDGPSKHTVLSAVDTVTPVQVKVGATALTDRKVITLQGDSKFYVYFADDAIVPSAATVAAEGFVQFKDQKESYEAGQRQIVFVLAVTGTVNIRVAERS
jgi:hypothetical protein